MEIINNISNEKLRGGFYTPVHIVDFILRWAFNKSIVKDILEPSCGDGIFLKRIKYNKYKYKTITAIEINKNEALKASEISLKNKKVIVDDFHHFCNNTNITFDLAIGNPPYIRYQYFNKSQQKEAEKIFKRLNLKYSKLTNAWVSFVIGSALLLRQKGRLGFVVPAELLQVSYAKKLRDFLSNFFNNIIIISFKKLVFPDIQQETILLLCEKNYSNKHFIEHVELENLSSLKDINFSIFKEPTKRIDFKNNKWTFYFLEQKEIDFIEELEKTCDIRRLGSYANVEVGITTGANKFFTVPLSTIKEYELEGFALPLVGRSVQIDGIKFTKKDWLKNRNTNVRAHLLVFPTLKELKNYHGTLKYIELGERENINKGYKCKIRNEWHIVPSIWISDALFIRRNNLYPKLIYNEAKALTTDTMHRIKLNEDIDIKAYTVSFYNSLSFAYSEITGRSYGGGVLELMPSEVENILLPYNKRNCILLEELDKLFRKKISIDKILNLTDYEILKKNLGFDQTDINILNNIWRKLSSRRINRNKYTNI